jgi:streptomycin 6-kinase
MKKLSENIENVFGNKGIEWLSNLPRLVDKLTAYWGLKDLVPVDNMTFNYVAKALSISNGPVVLKISCDTKSILEESQALVYFEGNASVKLIDYHKKLNALLLQQAIPGTTLKLIYPDQVEFVMDSYVNTMHKLHNKILPIKHGYRHISDWLKAIDKLNSNQLPEDILNKAINLKNSLLVSLGKEIFLHGDLHHDNIIKNNDQWLTIDPKGIIGEAEFEIAAFDFMYVTELSNEPNIKNIFESRVNLLAQKANLNAQRIKDWTFVRLILMAAWNLEDNCDASWAIKLAKNII